MSFYGIAFVWAWLMGHIQQVDGIGSHSSSSGCDAQHGREWQLPLLVDTFG